MNNKIIFRLLIVFVSYGFISFDCNGQDHTKLKSILDQNYSIKMIGDSIVIGERSVWGNEKTNYSENGKIYSQELFDEQGVLSIKTVYFYDSKGYENYMISFNSAGIKLDSIKINYDINGCVLNNLCFNGQDLYFKYEFIYNSENKKIQEDWITSSGEKERTFKYKYDSGGFVSEEISINYLRNRFDSIVYINDKIGNTLDEKRFKKDGKLDEVNLYKYKFDDNGNWIEMIRYLNGLPSSITKRMYIYYK